MIEETINRDSKIPGGIIGKSRNPQAVGQWVDTAADRSQITDNMTKIAGISESAPGLHKEAGPSHMKADEQSVSDVLTVITSMKDPFMHSEVLTSISTGVQATEATKENLSSAPSKGEQCLREFVQDRILTKKTPFYKPLQKMKLSTFSTQAAERVVKVSGKEMRIRGDRTFFCKLVFIAKTCDLDLYEVYSHELGPIPWALSTPLATPLKPDKSKLLEDLEKDVPAVLCRHGATWIIDAFAIIQTLRPVQKGNSLQKPSTFSEVAESILLSVCNVTQPQPARIHFVVDTYSQTSIKSMEREKHSIGKGQQSWEDISGTRFAPRDWSKFMASQESKQELPKFLLREWSGENSSKYAEKNSEGLYTISLP
jgi:hypothetical protein